MWKNHNVVCDRCGESSNRSVKIGIRVVAELCDPCSEFITVLVQTQLLTSPGPKDGLGAYSTLPHETHSARLALIEAAKKLTPQEVLAISINAGIHNSDGTLTERYRLPEPEWYYVNGVRYCSTCRTRRCTRQVGGSFACITPEERERSEWERALTKPADE